MRRRTLIPALFLTALAFAAPGFAHTDTTNAPAFLIVKVTITDTSVTVRPNAAPRGTNATFISERVQEKINSLRGYMLPNDLNVTVTRNYGETAKDKSNELLKHLFIATLSVTLLVALALGWRESGVVLLAVPVTLALTLAIFFLYGYTLNRVTLFALIFSIGILVDDAIVVVENIVRHFRLPECRGMPITKIAARAVDEVGNPTILATFAVIAAILPIAPGSIPHHASSSASGKKAIAAAFPRCPPALSGCPTGCSSKSSGRSGA